ncbi:type II toxin-antitoxin system HicA family toxin [Candidatus Electronema sp. PJ]|uniref:type II toxin-antitoxin system HicA family toxin n=1 Tax=Candidatus Electronema sp. PJ TaxID=3401572 RepID=UPI003AA9BD34
MSPKPLLVSGRRLVKLFQQLGYEETSQRGSHIKMKHHRTGSVVIIPDHKELDRWTLKTILKQAEISDEQYNQLLKQG